MMEGFALQSPTQDWSLAKISCRPANSVEEHTENNSVTGIGGTMLEGL